MFAATARRCYRHSLPPVTPEFAGLMATHTSTPTSPLNLGTLLSFGRPLTPSSLLDSVTYTLDEIPRRLATQVRTLEGLPYIVGTNPYVSKTIGAYRASFELLAKYPRPSTLEENASFSKKLESLVQKHADDVEVMAKGFQECLKYMSPSQISNVLDDTIRNRISIRLIAEQHIILSRGLADKKEGTSTGIVDVQCSPAKMISSCASFVSELCEASLGTSPEVILEGDTDATFAYVPIHLEYIATELLKNAFRATVEQHYKSKKHTSIPPVRITFALPPPDRPDGFLSVRIRDQGGGVSTSNMPRIFSYSFTTAGRGAEKSKYSEEEEDDDDGGPYAAQHIGGSAAITGGGGGLFQEITGKGLQAGMGTIAGLGYGLPMSRLYARYFGGSLDLMSLEGWGSDVFLKLRSLDGPVEEVMI